MDADEHRLRKKSLGGCGEGVNHRRTQMNTDKEESWVAGISKS